MDGKETLRMVLASADASLQAAQAAVRAAHSLLGPEESEAPPELCKFCGRPTLKEFEGGIVICDNCNRDQKE